LLSHGSLGALGSHEGLGFKAGDKKRAAGNYAFLSIKIRPNIDQVLINSLSEINQTPNKNLQKIDQNRSLDGGRGPGRLRPPSPPPEAPPRSKVQSFQVMGLSGKRPWVIMNRFGIHFGSNVAPNVAHKRCYVDPKNHVFD